MYDMCLIMQTGYSRELFENAFAMILSMTKPHKWYTFWMFSVYLHDFETFAAAGVGLPVQSDDSFGSLCQLQPHSIYFAIHSGICGYLAKNKTKLVPVAL